MRMKTCSWALSLALGVICGAPRAATAVDEPTRPIDIHFAPRTSPRESSASRKARQAEADRKAKDLEKQLKAQYGKDEFEWPPEKRMELLKAQGAGLDTMGEYDKATPKDVSDSIQDLTGAATGKPGDGLLHPVASPQEADLVVEVMGRRSEKAEPMVGLAAKYGLLLRVGPGGKLDPARLDNVKVFWLDSWGPASVNEVHRYSSQEPYWTLEILATVRWTEAANQAASLLADFVRKSPRLFSPNKD